MRVMVLLKSRIDEAGNPPTGAQHAEMDKYNEALINAGIRLDAQGLHPIAEGVSIDFTGGSTTVTDGPFAETKEFLVGFWVWQVESMDDAVEWAKNVPRGHGTRIELREIWDLDAIGDESTPESHQHKQRLREQVGTRDA